MRSPNKQPAERTAIIACFMLMGLLLDRERLSAADAAAPRHSRLSEKRMVRGHEKSRVALGAGMSAHIKGALGRRTDRAPQLAWGVKHPLLLGNVYVHGIRRRR